MNTNLTGFARVSTRQPEAFAICDTCGHLFNHTSLVQQMEFHGNSIRPTGFMVCTRTCTDTPQPQISTPILPNDPYPIKNPRPELYPGDAFEKASSPDPASWATPTSGLP